MQEHLYKNNILTARDFSDSTWWINLFVWNKMHYMYINSIVVFLLMEDHQSSKDFNLLFLDYQSNVLPLFSNRHWPFLPFLLHTTFVWLNLNKTLVFSLIKVIHKLHFLKKIILAWRNQFLKSKLLSVSR